MLKNESIRPKQEDQISDTEIFYCEDEYVSVFYMYENVTNVLLCPSSYRLPTQNKEATACKFCS